MIQLKKSTTLSEVARLSGVSLPVASAIVGNGKKGNVRYSEDTYNRVMEIVKLTNYRPSRTARKLRENRHGNIGILSRAIGSVQTEVLNLMQEKASEADQCLVFSDGSESKVPAFLQEDFVDGIVVVDYTYPGLEEQIAASGIPAVWVNTGVNKPGAIDYDEHGAMRIAVKHLVDRGKESFALFNTVHNHYSEQVRLESLRQITEDLGLADPVSLIPQTYIYDKDLHPQLVEEFVDFLQEHDHVDAVIMANDVMGAPLYSAARKLNKSIPGDLAAIGFMDSYVATALQPNLTSLKVNRFEAGARAIILLNEFIDGKWDNGSPEPMEYTLIIREST